MQEELNAQVAKLRDPDAGWVYRRDAADYLGKAVEISVDALRAVQKEKDVDVRTAAERALGKASAVLAGIAPPEEERVHGFDELAEGLARPGHREVARDGGDYIVTVQLKDGRSQKVYLREFARKDGAMFVQVLTYCGVFDESAMAWALKSNTHLGRCALAVAERNDGDQYVVVNCIPKAEATPKTVKAAVKEIAFYGDWIEKKLTGQDIM